MTEALSYYPETAAEVGIQVREAILDHDAFEQPLLPCALEKCKATCCYDGVYLGTEEVEMVKILVERELPNGTWDRFGLLSAEGHPLTPQNCLTVNENGRDKTQTRVAQDGELAEDFPSHFNKTRCVFLDKEGRCGLQRLAMEEGKQPWFYKPLTCWIHPIALAPPSDRGCRATLTLYNQNTDPHVEDGYPGFCSHTPCGKVTTLRTPAKHVLKEELNLLAEIAERPLLKELLQPREE